MNSPSSSPTPPKACSGLAPLLLAGLALLTTACSSPSRLPVVDDTQRRPVNAPGAIDLQACKAELQAARGLLAEARAEPAPTPPPAATESESRTAVLAFGRGQARIEPDADTRQALIDAATQARRIRIHAQGDGVRPADADNALARRRAESAAALLTRLAGVPADRLRVSWSPGVIDAARPDARQRVEIEFIDQPPSPWLARAASVASPARVVRDAGPGNTRPARPRDPGLPRPEGATPGAPPPATTTATVVAAARLVPSDRHLPKAPVATRSPSTQSPASPAAPARDPRQK